MSRMREHFYGFAELPGPLSEALFVDSPHLSSHQVDNMGGKNWLRNCTGQSSIRQREMLRRTEN
jgi:hypothetical protein